MRRSFSCKKFSPVYAALDGGKTFAAYVLPVIRRSLEMNQRDPLSPKPGTKLREDDPEIKSSSLDGGPFCEKAQKILCAKRRRTGEKDMNHETQAHDSVKGPISQYLEGRLCHKISMPLGPVEQCFAKPVSVALRKSVSNCTHRHGAKLLTRELC